MSSSYPPPPNDSETTEQQQQQSELTTAGGAVPVTRTADSAILDPSSSQHVAAAASTYQGLASPIAANAVITDPIVHHGLQALQAATAGTPLSPQQPSVQHQHHQHQPQTPQALEHHQQQQSYSPIASTHHAQQQYAHHHPSGPPITPVALSAPAPKMTRLRRACDMCSKRKVKCDDLGPPCTPCHDLNLECTRSREMKRRGPPNKHAEAAKLSKRPRLEPSSGSTLSPSPSNAAETLVSISAFDGGLGGSGGSIAAAGGGAPLDAELIAPYPVLSLLVDDFFTYIHPLIPFPHEPSFRQSFVNREDRTSREYLALLSSMIGCLVASFPRSAREHLKSLRNTNLFPRSITLIDRCRAVAMDARGVGFEAKREMTVYDAATSYFLGLAAGYTFQWQMFRRFMGQTMSIIRENNYHTKRSAIPSYALDFISQQSKPVDHIKEEVGKRVFWVIFVSVRSMAQLGVPQSELLIPPQTASEPYPDLPMEVDDQYILADRVLGQPEGTVSLLKGFNECVRTYLTMGPITSAELCYGLGSLPWNHQRTMINDGLRDAKQVTLGLPVELQLTPNEGTIPQSASADLEDAGYQYYPPAFPQGQPANDIRHVIAEQPAKRRKIQFEIQKANIFVSQLATRSYYVEKYFNLHDAWRESHKTTDNTGNGEESTKEGTSPEEDAETKATDASMLAEREFIVQNLLTVLASISQRNLEPNGASVINKIRQVASTLLNDRPERKGPVAQKAEEYLGQFLDILMKLEKSGRTSTAVVAAAAAAMQPQATGMGDTNMTLQDEEEELRVWADLREYQLKFAVAGGFLGEGAA
ncbi:hypothetical protein MKZ38_007475 [Zalerion maritima]|uniref:Zn(2)-C6 fungal-type domain-containing protein n=1 Tax=Zalerion maritima TaxID=339359 RepID=A0AAD5WU61_9PEZI|nr:hypothetical protein MKZ38_007475 [Zalerion maritima]